MDFHRFLLQLFSCMTLLYFNTSDAESLPKFCKDKSIGPDEITQCFLAQAKILWPGIGDGIPEQGMRPVDPFTADKLDIYVDGLALKLYDVNIRGIKGCSIDNSVFDPDYKYQTVDMTCELVVTGEYEMDGQLLGIPLRGAGDAEIKFSKITARMWWSYQVQNTIGKESLYLIDPKYTYAITDIVNFKFTKLYNNQAYGESTLDTLNRNWKEVSYSLAPYLINPVMDLLVGNLVKLYRQVPAEELLPIARW